MTEKVEGKWVFVETKRYMFTWCLFSDGIFKEHHKYIAEHELQNFMNEMSNNEDICLLKCYRIMDIDFEENK